MLNSGERRIRAWLAAAALLAQLAATGAGLIPVPALVLLGGATAVSPWFVTRPGARSARIGYVLAAAVAVNAGRQLLARPAGVTSAGISAALATLTLTLVLLTVVLAPAWRRCRDHRLWLAMSATVAVAACATGSGPAEAGTLVATWLVLLAAARVVHTSSLSSTADVVARVVRTSAPPRVALLRLAPIAVPAGLGALVFAALPGGLGGGALPSRIAHLVNPPRTFAPTRGLLGVDTMGSGYLDLRVRGALSTTPLLVVPAGAPPLWRGTVYRDYTGRDWHAPPPDANPEHRLVRGDDVTLLGAPDDPAPAGVARTDVVHRVPGTPSALAWAPGVIRRVRAEMLGAVRDMGVVRLFGSWHATDYTVTSVVATTTPAALRGSSGDDVADTSWTSLPAELPRRVGELARRVTAGARTRYDQVQALQTYLRTHETYALDSPVPASDEDAVDRFLFDDHVGFCEQFASAEAVMLRTLGVPARVVSGLAYGHRHHGGVLFTAADAHAWVEVFYPGVGWSPTDPTAGVRLATTASHHGGVLALLRRALGSVAGLAGTAFVVLLAFIGLVLVLVRRRRARSTRAPHPPVLEAFLGLVRRSRRPRHPAETAREYLARHDAIEPLAEALDALEEECYGARGPEPEETTRAVRVLTDHNPWT